MSETAICDVCKKKGLRKQSRWAPEGWHYGFSRDEEIGSTTVVIVCSEECQRAFWKPANAARVQDDPGEPRPTITQIKTRLHEILEDFSASRLLGLLAGVLEVRHQAGADVFKPHRDERRRRRTQ